MANPYATLGVRKSADQAEIKSAYRKLAKKLHPDRNKSNAKATERFSDVTKAYDLLSDKEKRAQYDRGEIDAEGNPAMPFGFGSGGSDYGGGSRAAQGSYRSGPRAAQSGGFGAEGIDLSDLLSGLSGGQFSAGFPSGAPGGTQRRTTQPSKGANITYTLLVSFVDAAVLSLQRLSLTGGSTIDLKLPAGVESGTKMRLAGKGQTGPGGSGDAIVTITIGEHPFFVRDGDDIRLDLPISLTEAVMGAKIKAPVFDGAVMVSVPASSTSGRILRLKGKGFSRKSGSRGDQLIRLMVDLPDGDKTLKEFAEKWQDNRNLRTAMNV